MKRFLLLTALFFGLGFTFATVAGASDTTSCAVASCNASMPDSTPVTPAPVPVTTTTTPAAAPVVVPSAPIVSNVVAPVTTTTTATVPPVVVTKTKVVTKVVNHTIVKQQYVVVHVPTVTAPASSAPSSELDSHTTSAVKTPAVTPLVKHSTVASDFASRTSKKLNWTLFGLLAVAILFTLWMLLRGYREVYLPFVARRARESE